MTLAALDSVDALTRAFRAGETTAVAIAEASDARTRRLDGGLNAFLTLDDSLLDAARALDAGAPAASPSARSPASPWR